MQIRTRDGGFETRGANPLAPWGSTTPPSNGSLGMATAGVVVSDHTALQLAAVYSSVALIADSIATLPIRQWRTVGGGPPAPMDPAPVIVQPWSEFTRRDFITQGTISLLLRGNLFGKVAARDKYLFPEQVQLVHPDHARIRRLGDGSIETRSWNKPIDPDDVTRAMGISLPEGLVGLNPIENMRNVLGLARAQDLYSGSFFANSARPDGVISVEGDLDVKEAKAMKQAWLQSHQGINGAFLPAVLAGGAKFQPISMNLADAQFLEQMQFSASVISGMIFRVPPHMIGMVTKDTSWGSGIEQQELGYVRNTLLIWLNRWEDLMTSWLPPGQFVTFDLSERLRGDTLQRWAAYQVARVIGAMNNEEIRDREGLPAADLSDPSYAQPLNSSPMPASVTQGGDKAN